MAAGIKYALLILPTHWDYDPAVRRLMRGMITWRARPSDLIAEGEVSQWKRWLGEMNWRDFEKKARLVLVSKHSHSVDIHNREGVSLRNRLGLAYFAMLLANPNRPFWGSARIIEGEALSISPTVELKTVKGTVDLTPTQRPYYDSRRVFSRRFLLKKPALLNDAYLDRWADLVPRLGRLQRSRPPRIINVALEAFRVALTRTGLEFAIPEFVRAAECILAVPAGRKGGRKVFAARAMQIAPGLAKHWFVGGRTLNDRLIKLYEHRIDCVHGKVPFAEKAPNGRSRKDEIAKAGYLAEALARECLLWVLNNTQKHRFLRDRPTLEDAWENGLVP